MESELIEQHFILEENNLWRCKECSGTYENENECLEHLKDSNLLNDETEKEIKITRVYSNPSRWTFTIKPIKNLLDKYVKDGKGWIDPFAGMNSPAEFTNDLNPDMKAKEHLWAIEWCQNLTGKYNGILLDPPYSPRQMKECYNAIGFKPTTKDTQNSPLYQNVKKAIADKIKIGGYAITCGWNSYGWGKKFGFEIIEILLVCHSHAHNDTIVIVERKVK